MNTTFLGNDPVSWAMAGALALAVLLALLLAKRMLIGTLRQLAARTTTELDDIAVTVLASTGPLFMGAVALVAGAQLLTMTPQARQLLHGAALATLMARLALWGDLAVRSWLVHYGARSDGAAATSTAALGFVARTAIWVIAALMILDSAGVNVSTLITSLGIGGIAVALALQNILGDLFASLSIVLDKPFMVGDFIVVDGAAGTVEYVGLKTTRVRSLGGEQIVFSNNDLLKSRIHNYKRMQTRRIAFSLGVTYQTAPAQLRELPQAIAAIVARCGARFDRAHLQGFGASSIDYEVVYIVESAEYQVYMDIQQEINLALVDHFARHGIEFAYPTRTVHHVGLDASLADAAAPGERARPRPVAAVAAGER